MFKHRNRIHILLPSAVTMICIFILAPLFIVICNSFSSVSYSMFPPPGFSLKWYFHLATQPQFLHAFFNSIIAAGGATLLALFVAALAAVAIQRYSFIGKNFIRAIFMSPMVVPKITLAVAYLIFFSQIKIVGGLIPLILGEAITIMPIIFAVLCSTLAGIQKDTEEAAIDLGARPILVFFTIVLPQMKTGLVLSAVISFILTFDQIETALLLLKPQNYTLPIELFLYMEKWQDPTIAVVSTILIFFAGLMVMAIKLALKYIPDIGKIFGK